jgi:hypothetical protein
VNTSSGAWCEDSPGEYPIFLESVQICLGMPKESLNLLEECLESIWNPLSIARGPFPRMGLKKFFRLLSLSIKNSCKIKKIRQNFILTTFWEFLSCVWLWIHFKKSTHFQCSPGNKIVYLTFQWIFQELMNSQPIEHVYDYFHNELSTSNTRVHFQ